MICRVSSGLTGTWGPGDTIVFGIGGPTGLWRVSASGGVPERLTELEPNEGDHDWPQILPGGEAVVFAIAPPSYNFDDAMIVVQSLSTGERKILIEGGSYPRYSSTGHLLFTRAGVLMAAPFDLDTLGATGPPVTVVEEVEQSAFVSGMAEYSVSEEGDLLYVRGDFLFPRTTAIWVDRLGEETPALPPGRYQAPSVSPDGSRVALMLRDEGMGDLYVYDLATGTPNRLTFDQQGGSGPIWSRDGKTLFFGRGQSGVGDRLFSKPADGTGALESLTEVEFWASSVSPEGDRILGVTPQNRETGWDIALVEVGSGNPPQPVVASAARESFPSFSPDGKWIVYQSDESGEDQVYVQPFPNVGGGKWQVSPSSGSGATPVWNPRGGEIFYRDGPALMAVPILSEEPFTVGSATELFAGSYVSSWWGSSAITPDGEHFLMLKNWNDPDESAELILVQNWFEELKRLVPTD